MDLDIPEPKDGGDSRLNAVVAVTVAALATFLGICKVTDDNIVQAMHQQQAHKLDSWAFYQARNIRQEIAEATVVQLELQRASAPAAAASAYDAALAKYRTLAKDQNAKKELLKVQAEEAERTYNALNFRDDQFDLSDAIMAIAIAMMAVTALTQLWALYWVSMVPTAFGVFMGLAALLRWPIHFETLGKLLT